MPLLDHDIHSNLYELQPSIGSSVLGLRFPPRVPCSNLGMGHLFVIHALEIDLL